ncbi:MAG TPA: polysaccharide deacetylase family protein [Candidatus Saccharimonadia bacterium]|jgi:peptidoglycan/xylan/chitin deacetylase (PgdA/CDA1 family)
MRVPKLSFNDAQLGRLLSFLGVVMVLAGAGWAQARAWPQSDLAPSYNVRFPSDLRKSYAKVVQNVRLFEDRQQRVHNTVASDRQLQDMLSAVQLDAANGNFVLAQQDATGVQKALDNWNLELSGGTKPADNPLANVFLPILIYHYTPPNFDEQLTYLEQHGYTVIDLDQAMLGLRGAAELPPKPAVITFDDGFANQMAAFTILQRHNMKATFFIINGGVASNWCIGAGRKYGLPSQPPNGCGDQYLSWDQVRMLDHSGLITIGGHTLDHSNLAGMSPDKQRHEIADSKAGIEQEIGHPIRDFAYPYGAYNNTTIQLVKEAGYDTAVTTLPGDYQSWDFQYTLRRVRDTLELP